MKNQNTGVSGQQNEKLYSVLLFVQAASFVAFRVFKHMPFAAGRLLCAGSLGLCFVNGLLLAILWLRRRMLQSVDPVENV